jgi:mycothiol synthase
MEASLATDAIPGFVPADINRTLDRLPADPTGTAVALEGDRVVGYITPRLDDLTVHPDNRRRGHGRRLVAEGLAIVRERGLEHLQLHGPQHLAASRAFIDALGFRYHSSLWLFALAPDVESPGPVFPPDVATRSFEPGDLVAYVDLLNDTFADHPTPLSWTVDAIRHVHGLPDFDPSGIRLVTPAGAPGELVAFTRVELETDPDGRLRGAVRLIGVRRAWRGRGLGRELLRWGVRHLRERGAAVVELAVEALNEKATRIYRAAGFVPAIEWPHYVLDAAPSSDGGGGPSR